MKSLAAADRHRRILDLLARDRRMPVKELIVALGASPATVRRDLGELVELGKLRRVHGGVLLAGEEIEEPGMDIRRAEALPEKRRIAVEAAMAVPGQGSVFLDAGTTCLEVAAVLIQRPGLTIYTNSASLLPLAATARARLVILGGECRPATLALVGAVTLDWLARLKFHAAILGATGVDAQEGVFTTEPGEAAVKSLAIRRARRSILVADSRKAEMHASVRFAQWNELTSWITDRGLPARRVGAFPVRVVRV
ncbi:MAG: DeoR/GlpR family DNA-binding transcription regulator [Terrimicrobiaceae bacterium]